MKIEIKLFTSRSCSWCPYVENMLRKIIAAHSIFDLNIIDIEEEIDLAEKYEIVALPTIILPSSERVIGCPDEEFLNSRLKIYVN